MKKTRNISLANFLVSFGVCFSLFFGICLFLSGLFSWPTIVFAIGLEILGYLIFVILLKQFLLKGLFILNKNISLMNEKYDLRLRQRLQGSQELDQLAKSLNAFIAKIHSTLYDLLNVLRLHKKIATQLKISTFKYNSVSANILARLSNIASSSAELTESLSRVEKNIEGIKSETDQIAAQINEQSTAVSQTSSAVEEMVANIQNITRIINEREAFAAEVVRLRQEASARFNQFTNAMQNVSKALASVNESINIINTIADQTGILAINASIEAANVGAAGKGFAIVARELKSLAENAQKNSVEVIYNLKNMLKEFTEAQTAVENAGRVFNGFSQAVHSFIESINEIASGLNEMNTGTKEILLALETLNTVSQEVTTSAKRIAEAVTIYKSAIDSLWELGAKNEEYAQKSSSEAAGISLELGQLAELAEKNLVTLGKIETAMQQIQLMDLASLKASDGQELISWSLEEPVIPPRPHDPLQYPETDRRRWWDYEYAGYNCKKLPQPPSPLDGPEGKRIAYLFNTFEDEANTYREALARGARKIAALYRMELSFYYANLDARLQAQQIDEVLALRPDLVVIEPTEAHDAVRHVKRLYAAGIPVIVSLMAIEAEAYQYILCYTGPDDWGQTRALAREFACRMQKQGGYCIIQHVPGSGTDYGRTYGAITELTEYAPQMTFLEKAFTNFDTDISDKTVTDWLAKYGRQLRGIITADDNHLLKGVVRALERAGRQDIVLASAGNSQTGMDFVKTGKVAVITYQSAEATAALPLVTAAEYFEGLPIRPVKKLPAKLITQENVADFYPPQF